MRQNPTSSRIAQLIFMLQSFHNQSSSDRLHNQTTIRFKLDFRDTYELFKSGLRPCRLVVGTHLVFCNCFTKSVSVLVLLGQTSDIQKYWVWRQLWEEKFLAIISWPRKAFNTQASLQHKRRNTNLARFLKSPKNHFYAFLLLSYNHTCGLELDVFFG